MVKYITLLIALLALASCSLDRSNPLDTNIVPAAVAGIDLTASPSSSETKWIRVSWERNGDVDGYFVYRSLSADGHYECLEEIPNSGGGTEQETMEWTDEDVSEGRYYFYKVSSYLDLSKGRLEGRLSSWVSILFR